jgi:hypothetical protein
MFPQPSFRYHSIRLAIAAVAGLAALTLSGCAAVVPAAVGELVEQRNKAEQAKMTSAMEVVAKEVAAWYTDQLDDPRLVENGGDYYLCSVNDSDSECLDDYNLIGPAADDIRVEIGRLGSKTTWCVQGENPATGQVMHVSATETFSDGPC